MIGAVGTGKPGPFPAANREAARLSVLARGGAYAPAAVPARPGKYGPRSITPALWERFGPVLRDAVAPGGDPFEQVGRLLAALTSGTADFWSGENSAAICGATPFLGGREYHVWLAGGSIPELRAMGVECCAHAERIGCERVVVHGRKGWARVLKQDGYRPLNVVAKDLG